MKITACRLLLLFLLIPFLSKAQTETELNSGWRCIKADELKANGSQVSATDYNVNQWMPATVPGTVLTTLVNNRKMPDPFYGMNNKQIPDIYYKGNAYYTYWFVTNFTHKKPAAGRTVFLNLRGINYTCEIFINGQKLKADDAQGMFLRQSHNITQYLKADGKNRLAILVHPAPVAGKPNGGQGGDGTIARNVGMQYTAGWDWIQPTADRNTGIWDKVTIQETGNVRINAPHVVTLVPGVRLPGAKQDAAIIKTSAELQNNTAKPVSGLLNYTINGQTVSKQVTLSANTTTEIALPALTMNNPKLWWPNGYGEQYLYPSNFEFTEGGKVLSDKQEMQVGIRQIDTKWNEITNSRQIAVNGQKIFIKGGNWIISDAMLRFSDARYDAEVRYHRDMNLNLIRIWGGAMIERPEFYAACDKYGMLVFQDFWMSGDCNGRWIDPAKTDDQWTRRKYPDDHSLFLRSAEDQIKMVRNHASLAIWCGGNEIPPPDDILVPLRDQLLPKLDGTRWFIDYSNSAEMSYNTDGGNGDGPYGIQNINTFWQHKTFPFNSEVGSVGVGDYESLQRFIPAANLKAPKFDGKKESVDSVWDYHKYIGYENSIKPYGEAKDARDFAMKAQLVNYDQYRALMEGFSSHMWEWYTGSIIWKTQNPWTALRGQMYDYYLDANACLYGLRSGSEPVHVAYNPVDGNIIAINNGFKNLNNHMLVVKTYDMAGRDSLLTQVFISIGASSYQKVLSLKSQVDALRKKDGVFLSVQLLDERKQVQSNNFYWLPNMDGEYSGLQYIKKAKLNVFAKQLANGKVEISLTNPKGGPVAFFNRLALINSTTKQRVLPAFTADNYLSVMPGESKKVVIEYPQTVKDRLQLQLYGWNVDEQILDIN
ncbi:glycosyl hydrolase [Mucilaginibacter achroorhodeus]|uniref:Glycosyl hydrolase n=1 Tax=Mucilaginibacter achroorhodeus TaxID=2599294 RepID=A0A563U9X5_9SPHI|nr:glycoside hydrolase family 2 TIM barrel-domain containing protein [Mucilaginibacter achroorhodeus]TWR28079.1 glycosyl hydrolase [Mucilaginibacter achroorhodeus]